MITFEKAYEIAGELRDNIERCDEYENGWIFWCHRESDVPADGGPDGGHIVVCREDGAVMNMGMLIMRGAGRHIGEVDLKTGEHIEVDEEYEWYVE